jgi:hypothetical protein
MRKTMRTLTDAEVKVNLRTLLDEVAQGILERAAVIRGRERLNRTRAEDLVREDRSR